MMCSGIWKYCFASLGGKRMWGWMALGCLLFFGLCLIDSVNMLRGTDDASQALFLTVYGGTANGVVLILPQIKNWVMIAIMLAAMSTCLNDKNCLLEVVISRCGSGEYYYFAKMVCGAVFPIMGMVIRLLALLMLGIVYCTPVSWQYVGSASMACGMSIWITWLWYSDLVLYLRRSDKACAVIITLCLASIYLQPINIVFPFAYEDMLRWKFMDDPFASETWEIIGSWAVSVSISVGSLLFYFKRGGIYQ